MTISIRPRFSDLAAIAVAVALIAVLRVPPLYNPDTLWQIRTGDVIRAAHHRLTVDVFSFTQRGQPIHDHEAGFEVVLSFVDGLGGLRLLWAVNVIGAMALVGVSMAWARRIAVRDRTELRAEIATTLAVFFAHRLRRELRVPIEPNDRLTLRQWLVRLSPIPIAACAIPFHGLALIVAAVPTAHGLECFARAIARPHARLGWLRQTAIEAAIALSTIAATELVAPGTLANVFANSTGSTFAAHIVEFYSPWRFYERSGDPSVLLALALTPIAIAGLIRSAREFQGDRARFADAFLLAILWLPALRFDRFAMLAPLIALPWAIGGLAVWIDLLAERARSAIAVAATVVAFALGGWRATGDEPGWIHGLSLAGHPIGAVAWLKSERPNALLFSSYNDGPYLIYAHYPPRGVEIDPRAATVYPDAIAARYYAAIANADVFEAWATEAPFDTVLLANGHKSSAPLRDHLANDPGWRRIYLDTHSIVFERAR
jgi:hypothetical protein